MLIVRKLIVDENNEIFDAQGMKFVEFPSDFHRVREYTKHVMKDAPERFLEDTLLEQQLSEIIKNAIKHGNGSNPTKKVRIWYDMRNRVRFIVEDDGDGFEDLEVWNAFYAKRQTALHHQDFASFLALASYRGPKSDEDDGGNSLISALEYWNGGIIYNRKKNKVGVIRWFTHGSSGD